MGALTLHAEQNVDAGAQIPEDLNQRFDGNLTKTMRRLHAGEGNVRATTRAGRFRRNPLLREKVHVALRSESRS